MYEGRICQQKINEISNNSALILCDETYFFFLCQSSLDLRRSSVAAVKSVRIHHWEWFSRYTDLRCWIIPKVLEQHQLFFIVLKNKQYGVRMPFSMVSIVREHAFCPVT